MKTYIAHITRCQCPGNKTNRNSDHNRNDCGWAATHKTDSTLAVCQHCMHHC